MEGRNVDVERPDHGDDEVTGRRRALIETLRSGKYRQTTGVLRRLPNLAINEPGGYCCLGVACEVAIGQGLELEKIVPDGAGAMFYGDAADGSNNVLPDPVVRWYAFVDDNPWLKVPGEVRDELGWTPEDQEAGPYAAAELNDTHCLTLSQIADCFEYTFLPQDWEATRASRRP